MKRYLVLLLIVLFSMCVVACGGDSEKSSSNTSQQTSAQKSKFHNQDLTKLIPIAKALVLNETEVREIEKILSSLDIDFNNIKEIKGGNYGPISSSQLEDYLREKVRVIDLIYQLGKGEYFVASNKSFTKSNYDTRTCTLVMRDKTLVAVYADNHRNDQVYLYYNGITYHKLSDFVITDSMRDKITKSAMQKILDSEIGKKYSDIKLVSSNLKVASYDKSHGRGLRSEEIYRDKYLTRLNTSKWYKNIKPTPYIQIAITANGKEKYFGGEKDVLIEMRAYYDVQGNYVTSEKFEANFSGYDDYSYIIANGDAGGNIDLGQSIDIKKEPYESILIQQSKNNSTNNDGIDLRAKAVITGDDVNVREGPGTNYKSLGVFYKGDIVRLVDINSSAKEGWYKVEFDNPQVGLITGWVKSDYISNNVSVPTISANAITDVKHSSALNDNGYIYSGKLTLDGDLSTCWAEGVPGLGIGESITYFFDKNYLINGVTIHPGHQKSPDLYEKNARPKFIRLISSNGFKEDCIFKNFEYNQTITFAYPIIAKSIKLVIEDVIRGDKYEDTCIAEVKFF